MSKDIPQLIATIGPASGSAETLRKLKSGGMQAGRLNMSHGTHQSHSTYIDGLRRIQVPIMGDLSGPRMGTGSGHAFDSSLPAFTDKDRFDLAFAAKHQLDWIILSYAKDQNDINLLKDEMKKLRYSAKVAVKIEHQTAVDNLDQLIAHSDLVIVARGDLADAVGLKHIAPTALSIISACKKQHQPVVVATEILTSMIDAEHPTRAEATDAWLHGYVGSSGIMLSNETAIGKRPDEAVQWGSTLFQQGKRDRKQGIQLLA
jgi:pyruvate kinase